MASAAAMAAAEMLAISKIEIREHGHNRRGRMKAKAFTCDLVLW